MPLLGLVAITIFSAGALPSQEAGRPTNPAQKAESAQNKALADEIKQLFNEDQNFLAELNKDKQDPVFSKNFKSFVPLVEAEHHNSNFYDPQVYTLWAQKQDAPETVRHYAAFHRGTDARIRSIVAHYKWPRREAVGDEAAAEFFFLFGHADDDNNWRLSQLGTIERVFREDGVNPRLYAHLCDRLANVAGNPQIFGSVMGPGESPGTAKLYWPLIDTVAAADKRRTDIGLPSIEEDLAKFREGANIGPYMTPITKGMEWSLADVYNRAVK